MDFAAFLPFILMPLFAAAAFTQIFLMRKAKNILIDRHPQAYLDAERQAWIPGRGVQRMVFGRWGIGGKYRALGDPELDQCVHTMRMVWFGLILLAAIVIAAISVLPEPRT